MDTREQLRVPSTCILPSKFIQNHIFFYFLFTFHGIDQGHSPSSKAATADSNQQTKQQNQF